MGFNPQQIPIFLVQSFLIHLFEAVIYPWRKFADIKVDMFGVIIALPKLVILIDRFKLTYISYLNVSEDGLVNWCEKFWNAMEAVCVKRVDGLKMKGWQKEREDRKYKSGEMERGDKFKIGEGNGKWEERKGIIKEIHTFVTYQPA